MLHQLWHVSVGGGTFASFSTTYGRYFGIPCPPHPGSRDLHSTVPCRMQRYRFASETIPCRMQQYLSLLACPSWGNHRFRIGLGAISLESSRWNPPGLQGGRSEVQSRVATLAPHRPLRRRDRDSHPHTATRRTSSSSPQRPKREAGGEGKGRDEGGRRRSKVIIGAEIRLASLFLCLKRPDLIMDEQFR